MTSQAPLSFESDQGTVQVFSTAPPPEREIVHSNALPRSDEEARRLERAGAIAPPYPPAWLCALYDQSTALRPAIEALEANVDGHGHRYEPRFKLDAQDAREQVKEALIYERMMKLGGFRRMRSTTAAIIPSDLEIDMRIGELGARMRLERMRLEALFSACCPGSDFVRIRKELRRDVEVTGNAYLGVRRDNGGDVAEFEYLPSVSMRLRPVVATLDSRKPALVPVQIPVRRTPITFDAVTSYRPFRTFVQFGLVGNIYFKQFGDPRMFSSVTGKPVADEDELRGDPPATEVIHLRVPSGLYEYGVPRWIAASPVVTGLRDSQVVNAIHFDHNAIPRMFILVNGGILKQDGKEKIGDLLTAHAKGIENYGSVIILQATPSGNNPNARVQIEVKPMKEAIPDDALFLNYGARCRDEVLSQFRLPKFITGQLEDVNRSTAKEGLAFVEDQVFQPLRYDFDVEMNALLQAEGIMFWQFVSNSPISRDPTTSATIIGQLATAGGASINDVRDAMEEITNRAHPRRKEPWADLPLELAKLAFAPPPGAPITSAVLPEDTADKGIVSKAASAAPPARLVSSPRELVEYLLHAREVLERGESEHFAAEFFGPAGRTLVIPVAGAELDELVTAA